MPRAIVFGEESRPVTPAPVVASGRPPGGIVFEPVVKKVAQPVSLDDDRIGITERVALEQLLTQYCTTGLDRDSVKRKAMSIVDMDGDTVATAGANILTQQDAMSKAVADIQAQLTTSDVVSFLERAVETCSGGAKKQATSFFDRLKQKVGDQPAPITPDEMADKLKAAREWLAIIEKRAKTTAASVKEHAERVVSFKVSLRIAYQMRDPRLNDSDRQRFNSRITLFDAAAMQADLMAKAAELNCATVTKLGERAEYIGTVLLPAYRVSSKL
jgi:hypothetical protein